MAAAIQTEGVQFRKRATLKMVLGFCAALATAAFFVLVCNEGDLPKSPLWSIFSTVPFAYCVIGTIESTTHRPYRDLAADWKTLKTSQRVQLGIFLFFAGLLVFTLAAASLFHLWLIAHGNG
jgi:hypothetical protein